MGSRGCRSGPHLCLPAFCPYRGRYGAPKRGNGSNHGSDDHVASATRQRKPPCDIRSEPEDLDSHLTESEPASDRSILWTRERATIAWVPCSDNSFIPSGGSVPEACLPSCCVPSS